MAIPEMTASIPDMHTRLMVAAMTVSGIDDRSAATRLTLKASMGSIQHPYRTSSIIPASIPALFIASIMVTAAIAGALLSLRLPPNAPIAVRQPDTITTSRIIAYSFQNRFKIFHKESFHFIYYVDKLTEKTNDNLSNRNIFK
jgi:hypothetical protein